MHQTAALRPSTPHPFRNRVALVTLGSVLMMAGLLTMRTADAAASPHCGTWALQQSLSISQLDGMRGAIGDALATPGLKGFSLRTSWEAIDTDFSLLDRGLAMARDHDVAYTVRFMAGQHTPARVVNAGPSYTTTSGARVPAPFSPDGRPNAAFEREFDLIVGKVAAWARANGVHLLHLPWYGQDWAELNHGVEVRSVPGYSYENWLNAHKRLIDIGLEHAGPELTVEFPMSGYGPLIDAADDLSAHIVSKVGANSPLVFVQANGWGPTGDWGAPDAGVEAAMDRSVWPKAVNRGEQAIQPDDYDWAALYDTLRTNRATYAEVYVPSFGMARGAQLDAEIAQFAHECGQVASTTTTTTAPTTTTAEAPTTTIAPPRDDEAPTTPQNLRVVDRGAGWIWLDWDRSADDERVLGYEVRRDGRFADRVRWSRYVDRGSVDAGRSSTYSVQAVDSDGNRSEEAVLVTGPAVAEVAARAAEVTPAPAPVQGPPAPAPAPAGPVESGADPSWLWTRGF